MDVRTPITFKSAIQYVGLLALGVALASSVTAQTVDRWTTAQPSVEGGGASASVATVSAPSGEMLRVYKDRNSLLHMSLRLRDGFEQMDTRVCPSIQFDAGGADASNIATTRCEADSRGARFSLGRIESEQVRSALLRRLMTRTRITLRVKLRSLGYREVHFTLRGSMQAMVAVLGQGVQVTNEAP